MKREEAIRKIFSIYSEDSVFIVPTGYTSRAVYNMFPKNKNIFYMRGSMGIAPAIGFGISLFTKKDVVVINGDASHLMHLGLVSTIKHYNRNNLYIHILNNGCHESVGCYEIPSLDIIGLTENYMIWNISCDGKLPRVDISFEENANNLKEFLKC